jgi:hypothetical protein
MTSRHFFTHHDMMRHATLNGPEMSDYYISREKILGRRVRFKSTTDLSSKLVFNDLGTVIAIAESSGCLGKQNMKLLIRWDSGCLYPLIDGVDSFDIFVEAGI